MSDLLAVVLVVIAFLVTNLLLALNFMKRQDLKHSLRVQSDLMKQRLEFNQPHRMEAFQRTILYLERIHPFSLTMRLLSQSDDPKILKELMIKSIRDEYDHNVAQQLFISLESWKLIKSAKEETIKLIAISESKLGDKATSTDLATTLLTLTAEVNPLPSEIALLALKAEYKNYL